MSDEKPKVKTFDDWQNDYIDADFDSPEEAEAMAKMAETASTREDWEYIYDQAEVGSDLQAKAKAEMEKFDQ